MATIAPLMNADLTVQVHVAAAVVALGLAPVQLLRRKRGRLHRVIGYAWVLAMALAALSSFLIHEIRLVGLFSPIHLLSIYLLWGLWRGVRLAMAGQYRDHRQMMQALVFRALGLAGLFALLPGRLLNTAVFGNYAVEGFASVLVLCVLGLSLLPPSGGGGDGAAPI